MSRDSKNQYFLKLAKLLADRSTCSRRKVGCVIVNKYGHIMSTGYNGVPMNFPHCTDFKCEGVKYSAGEGLSSCLAVHAEQNALLQCSNIMEIDTIYCTTSPCITCAKLILNTSCKTLIYYEEYANVEGIELLKKMQVEVIHERIRD